MVVTSVAVFYKGKNIKLKIMRVIANKKLRNDIVEKNKQVEELHTSTEINIATTNIQEAQYYS